MLFNDQKKWNQSEYKINRIQRAKNRLIWKFSTPFFGSNAFREALVFTSTYIYSSTYIYVTCLRSSQLNIFVRNIFTAPSQSEAFKIYLSEGF